MEVEERRREVHGRRRPHLGATSSIGSDKVRIPPNVQVPAAWRADVADAAAGLLGGVANAGVGYQDGHPMDLEELDDRALNIALGDVSHQLTDLHLQPPWAR